MRTAHAVTTLCAVVANLALVAGFALPPRVVLAQDTVAAPSPENPLAGDALATARAAWKESDCISCHGWSGNGTETGPVPPGPSLRESALDYASAREIIQCGIPGGQMPSHDRMAYVDTRCYGLKSADLGSSKPLKGDSLKAADLDAVAAYVTGYLEGRGPITPEECEEYFQGTNPNCGSYR